MSHGHNGLAGPLTEFTSLGTGFHDDPNLFCLDLFPLASDFPQQFELSQGFFFHGPDWMQSRF